MMRRRLHILVWTVVLMIVALPVIPHHHHHHSMCVIAHHDAGDAPSHAPVSGENRHPRHSSDENHHQKDVCKDDFQATAAKQHHSAADRQVVMPAFLAALFDPWQVADVVCCFAIADGYATYYQSAELTGRLSLRAPPLFLSSSLL